MSSDTLSTFLVEEAALRTEKRGRVVVLSLLDTTSGCFTPDYHRQLRTARRTGDAELREVTQS
jgi:hypothetical protein